VITTGGTASAGGLLQAQGLRDALDLLRGRTDWVVVEAPSTATGADAQSLASLADAAILAVELRRTRRPEVTDAAEQLRRVGTPLLGAVVLPRLSRRHEQPGAAPPPAPAAAGARPDAFDGEPQPASQADLDASAEPTEAISLATAKPSRAGESARSEPKPKPREPAPQRLTGEEPPTKAMSFGDAGTETGTDRHDDAGDDEQTLVFKRIPQRDPAR
jgi:hypothetical protein